MPGTGIPFSFPCRWRFTRSRGSGSRRGRWPGREQAAGAVPGNSVARRPERKTPARRSSAGKCLGPTEGNHRLISFRGPFLLPFARQVQDPGAGRAREGRCAAVVPCSPRPPADEPQDPPPRAARTASPANPSSSAASRDISRLHQNQAAPFRLNFADRRASRAMWARIAACARRSRSSGASRRSGSTASSNRAMKPRRAALVTSRPS